MSTPPLNAQWELDPELQQPRSASRSENAAEQAQDSWEQEWWNESVAALTDNEKQLPDTERADVPAEDPVCAAALDPSEASAKRFHSQELWKHAWIVYAMLLGGSATFLIGLSFGWLMLRPPQVLEQSTPLPRAVEPVKTRRVQQESPPTKTLPTKSFPTKVLPQPKHAPAPQRDNKLRFALQVGACRSEVCVRSYSEALAGHVDKEQIRVMETNQAGMRRIHIVHLQRKEAIRLRETLARQDRRLRDAFLVMRPISSVR